MVKMEMKKPSIWKRILAAITDFFLAFLLFGILFVFAIQPIYNKFTDYQKTVDSYYTKMSQTGLYTYNTKTNICNIIEPKIEEGEELTSKDYVDFYESKIYEYFESNEKIDSYLDLKRQSGLFNVGDTSATLKDDINAEELKRFYIHSINYAIEDIFMKDEDIIKIANEIDNYTMEMIAISAIPSFVIFYFVFPLVFHGGQTLGKKMFNLKIASTETGFEVSKLTIIVRQFAVVVIGYIGAYFTYGLSLLAYILIPFFHKKGVSIDDFISNTIVYENVDVADLKDEEKISVVLKSKPSKIEVNKEDVTN